MGMSRTISGSYSSPITLSSTADNPIFVTGTILVSKSSALYGQGGSGQSWTINNSGLISCAIGTHARQYGIYFEAASTGAVTNSGTITGGTGYKDYGIVSSGSASVTNVNGGLIVGISLAAGGAVFNHAGGTISSSMTASAIRGLNGNISVVNQGVVTGGSKVSSPVAIFNPNYLYNEGGSIYGARGVALASGTVINTGSIVGGKSSNGYYAIAISGDPSALLVNKSGGTIAAGPGAYGIKEHSGTVRNAGTITASFGAYLGTGSALLTNQLGGLIDGSTYGVRIAAGTVVNESGGRLTGGYGAYLKPNTLSGTVSLSNAGTIDGHSGIRLRGGVVSNQAGGTISAGSYGVFIGYQGGTLTNAGVIIGGGGGAPDAGVSIRRPGVHYGSPGGAGVIVNAKGGSIGGYRGVYLRAGATLTNAGTIAATGAGKYAVYVDAYTTNRLIVDPGAVFTGAIGNPGTTSSNVLELASGASRGTLAGVGSTVLNFGTIAFDSGASWLLGGNAGGLARPAIDGFTIGDTIDLTGFVAVSKTFASNKLVLTDAGNAHTTIGIVGAFTSGDFAIQGDGSGGTDFSVACYCRGTRILTPAGEVAVEALAIGDEVVTLSGEARPIRWIGHRAYDGRFTAGNRQVLPVRIATDALAPGVPARDLHLSPEHSLYVDGVLVQAMHLVNGATITQAERVERVEYFHIELDDHNVLFADGAPAETFVDCDNRLMFANGAEYARLYPGDDRPTWEFCVERLEWDTEELTRIRAALLERAEAQGHVLDSDPDPHLVVDGKVVRPDSVAGGVYRFAVPTGSAAVSLASRSAVPVEIIAASRDIRRLGLPVERIMLYDEDLLIEVLHGHAGLANGFHADEAGHRWTNGMARLPDSLLRSFVGAFTLELRMAPSDLVYQIPPSLDTAATA
jgi:hypothetical protein